MTPDQISEIMKDVLVSLGIVAGFYVAGKASIFIIDRFVRKLTEKTSTQLDDMLLAVVEKPAFWLIMLWGIYVALHRLSMEFARRFFDVADKAVFIVAVAFIVKVVYDVVNTLIDWYGVTMAGRGQEGLGKSILPLLKKLVKIFAIISGLIVILDHFSYNISSLVAALGVSSLAIGLAAKETLANMISGFTIVADRPFRIGDRIEVDKKTGDVVEIGLRSTRIRTIDNTIVIIPNSKLVDNVLLNYAYPEDSLAGFFKVSVEYGSPVEKVRATLLQVANEIQEIMKDPAPEVQFIEHADSALVFQLVYRIPEYKLKWPLIDKLNTAVNRRFAEEGINFAYPTRTMYLRKLDDATV